MINLMDPVQSANLRYRHINSILRRWIIMLTLATLGLLLVVILGWLYIGNQNRQLTGSINSTQQQLQTQNLTSVKTQATTISNNVKIINQVLSKEIRFSSLLQAIGTVIPSGAVLSGLSLNDVNGAIDLSANSTNYVSAAQLAVNLGDPKNNIFQKVDIINITCTEVKGNAYPCTAQYKALFGPTTKNRFLNVPSGAQK